MSKLLTKEKIRLARDEYRIELNKNTAFTTSVGTLLSLLAGTSTLAPYMKKIEINYSTIITIFLILACLGRIYVIFLNNTQNRVNLKEFIDNKYNDKNRDGWEYGILDAYVRSINDMRTRRKSQQLNVGIASVAVVILNYILAIFL